MQLEKFTSAVCGSLFCKVHPQRRIHLQVQRIISNRGLMLRPHPTRFAQPLCILHLCLASSKFKAGRLNKKRIHKQRLPLHVGGATVQSYMEALTVYLIVRSMHGRQIIIFSYFKEHYNCVAKHVSVWVYEIIKRFSQNDEDHQLLQ